MPDFQNLSFLDKITSKNNNIFFAIFSVVKISDDCDALFIGAAETGYKSILGTKSLLFHTNFKNTTTLQFSQAFKKKKRDNLDLE